jgi:CheY-like chemotaxis protein
VLLNLAVNARDAMPSGGRLLVSTSNQALESPVHAQPEPVPPGRWVLLEVRDTGCGMDAETRARLFEPFFTTKPHGKGTGLGLATVYGIVTQSGGHVTVESEPEKGARFLVWLPAVEEALDVSARTDEASGRGSETILLVEDDADVRGFLSEVLHNHGYRVVQARDGVEALRLAEAELERLDLVLTDVVMPRMGGAELATQLRALKPALRVLYISGYPGEAGVSRALFPRGAPLLQKPFSIAELARRIRDALA